MSETERDSLFLDSNIWLYAISVDTEDPATIEQRKVATELTQSSGMVVSFQVVNEVCKNAIKKLHFTHEQTFELIQDFYSSCTVFESN